MEPVHADEVRILEGPNLYVTRPAVKVSLALPGVAQLDVHAALDLARRVGLRTARPGRPDTGQRQRFSCGSSSTSCAAWRPSPGARRLAVRTRAGRLPKRRGRRAVEAPWPSDRVGESLAPLLSDLLKADDTEALIAAAGRAVAEPLMEARCGAHADGPGHRHYRHERQTTTTRLVAHMVMTAGLRTAWSSTDGVVVMGEMVQPGDYSGPGGAREVLNTPGLQLGILETARGGMLLRGMGVNQTDVTVVTNVAADHLGLNGIDTLDQLAEVKAIPTLIVKPDGWTVLNGDDRGCGPCATGRRARSGLVPNAPALREAVAGGGHGSPSDGRSSSDPG
jgi:cyanophycin synthetase